MIHLGDITKINGSEIEKVDVVCGGSPCQDLSIAGKRAGLSGERSGLYMEEIRVIKEMRESDRKSGRADGLLRPRYMVFENVPGLLSSNKNEDFGCVLTEAIRIAEPEAPDVPVPQAGWTNAGYIYDDMGRWSLAWRITDAQHFGVAQRRKRICMLVDFNGMSAGRILFAPELRGESERDEPGKAVGGPGDEHGCEIPIVATGVSGDPEPCGEKGQGIAGRAADRAGSAGKAYTLKIRGGVDVDSAGKKAGKGALVQNELSGTLGVSQDQTLFCIEGNGSRPSALIENEPAMIEMTSTKNTVVEDGISPTLTARMGTGGNQVNAVQCMDVGFFQATEDVAPAQLSRQYKDPPIVGTLCGQGYPDKLTHQDVVSGLYPVQKSVVRRLTPTECERLQGFPDGWTDIGKWTDSKGKEHESSDSMRYKALGNSIAVGFANRQSGFWCWLLKRISAEYERSATLGSLFDGIGGFPLAWEFYNGKGSARWASEIEEFPIAVTQYHFGEGRERNG